MMRNNDYLKCRTYPHCIWSKKNLKSFLKKLLTYLINQKIWQKNHTEEVVIGSEQGTTFPTKIGTTICNALIDTGVTRSCVSEKYYKRLHLTKIHSLQNVNVKSATGSNLAPVGLVNCTFEL